MTHFSDMAVRCLRIRAQLGEEFWGTFMAVEGAALRHALAQDAAQVGAPEPDLSPLEEYPALSLVPDAFRCDPDESGGYALDDPKRTTLETGFRGLRG